MNYSNERLSREQIEYMIRLFNTSMDDYLYVLDFKNDYYYISKHATNRFLLPGNQFYNAVAEFQKIVYPEDFPAIKAQLDDIQQGKSDYHNLHYRWLDRNRNPVWINCRGQVVLNEKGEPQFLVGCINEIGKKQKADNVSGLLGEPSLQIYIHDMAMTRPQGFLMQVDIDDFNIVTGRLGSKYGDFILEKTARCIEKCMHKGQRLFRLNGDEFMIVDFQGGSQKDAIKLYKQIRKEIDTFIEKNQYHVVFTLSAGILDVKDVRGSYDLIVKYCEFALNEAKQLGKNSYYVFSQDNYDGFLRKRCIRLALQYSVNHSYEGFEVYYQPIVDSKTHAILGAEALMRFNLIDEKQKVERISPVEFIPLLEESGLIIPAGKWILYQALSTCKKWQKEIPHFKINVNLSYVQVIKSSVLNEIIAALRLYDLDSSCLGIEVTESGYLGNNPHFKKLWNKLKSEGIAVIIDDFGTGYSNVHRLSDLYPRYIKIDRSLTMKAISSEYENKILKHVVDMAHSIDLAVCIEGVETKEELQALDQLHPDYIQGYLFGKPVTKKEFEKQYMSKKDDLLQ